jgi:hypothetical protein
MGLDQQVDVVNLQGLLHKHGDKLLGLDNGFAAIANEVKV